MKVIETSPVAKVRTGPISSEENQVNSMEQVA
jgi:hypothetical protein